MNRERLEKEIAFRLEKNGIAELCRNNKKAKELEDFMLEITDWLFNTKYYLVLDMPLIIENNGKGYKIIDNSNVIHYFDDTELTEINGIYHYSGRETPVIDNLK